MGKYLVTMGDFLKNAGIVGLNYMLDMSDAERKGLWLKNAEQTGRWA